MKQSNNYKAWTVSESEFDKSASTIDKLRFFSRYAILSPSGHNTQPWVFSFKNDYLIITENPARELPHSGKVAAEPYVSIGACTETLVLAGEAFGYKIDIKTTLKPVIEVQARIAGNIAPNTALARSIVTRVSNREPFETQKIAHDILKQICTSNKSTISEKIVDDRMDIAFIARETAKATINIMADPAFRLELSKWVRNNLTKQYDGMPAFVQGMPTPPSLIARHIIKNVDISKSQAKKDASRIEKSAAIIILSTQNQESNSYFDLGREYARICIIAQQNGLATSGVGAAVIDTESKLGIKKHFNLSGTPSALIRIGKATKNVHHAPRLTLDMVTSK
jgi:hypothetical protein